MLASFQNLDHLWFEILLSLDMAYPTPVSDAGPWESTLGPSSGIHLSLKASMDI